MNECKTGQSTSKRLRISELNPHLLCALCGGYFIDATTIVECLHSFCKTCIVCHLATNSYCPICKTPLHKTRPWQNIRPDHSLQTAVYKLVPGLFRNEMKKRREFYEKRNLLGKLQPYYDDRVIFSPEDQFSISIEFCPDGKPAQYTRTVSFKWSQSPPDKRYLLCPAGLKIYHLKKFLQSKFSPPQTVQIDMFYQSEPLCSTYSLMDVAYIYSWKRDCILELFYSFYEIAKNEKKHRLITDVKEKVSKKQKIVNEKEFKTRANKKMKNMKREKKDEKHHKISRKRKFSAKSTLSSIDILSKAEPSSVSSHINILSTTGHDSAVLTVNNVSAKEHNNISPSSNTSSTTGHNYSSSSSNTSLTKGHNNTSLTTGQCNTSSTTGHNNSSLSTNISPTEELINASSLSNSSSVAENTIAESPIIIESTAESNFNSPFIKNAFPVEHVSPTSSYNSASLSGYTIIPYSPSNRHTTYGHELRKSVSNISTPEPAKQEIVFKNRKRKHKEKSNSTHKSMSVLTATTLLPSVRLMNYSKRKRTLVETSSCGYSTASAPAKLIQLPEHTTYTIVAQPCLKSNRKSSDDQTSKSSIKLFIRSSHARERGHGSESNDEESQSTTTRFQNMVTVPRVTSYTCHNNKEMSQQIYNNIPTNNKFVNYMDKKINICDKLLQGCRRIRKNKETLPPDKDKKSQIDNTILKRKCKITIDAKPVLNSNSKIINTSDAKVKVVSVNKLVFNKDKSGLMNRKLKINDSQCKIEEDTFRIRKRVLNTNVNTSKAALTGNKEKHQNDKGVDNIQDKRLHNMDAVPIVLDKKSQSSDRLIEMENKCQNDEAISYAKDLAKTEIDDKTSTNNEFISDAKNNNKSHIVTEVNDNLVPNYKLITKKNDNGFQTSNLVKGVKNINVPKSDKLSSANEDVHKENISLQIKDSKLGDSEIRLISRSHSFDIIDSIENSSQVKLQDFKLPSIAHSSSRVHKRLAKVEKILDAEKNEKTINAISVSNQDMELTVKVVTACESLVPEREVFTSSETPVATPKQICVDQDKQVSNNSKTIEYSVASHNKNNKIPSLVNHNNNKEIQSHSCNQETTVEENQDLTNLNRNRFDDNSVDGISIVRPVLDTSDATEYNRAESGSKLCHNFVRTKNFPVILTEDRLSVTNIASSKHRFNAKVKKKLHIGSSNDSLLDTNPNVSPAVDGNKLSYVENTKVSPVATSTTDSAVVTLIKHFPEVDYSKKSEDSSLDKKFVNNLKNTTPRQTFVMNTGIDHFSANNLLLPSAKGTSRIIRNQSSTTLSNAKRIINGKINKPDTPQRTLSYGVSRCIKRNVGYKQDNMQSKLMIKKTFYDFRQSLSGNTPRSWNCKVKAMSKGRILQKTENRFPGTTKKQSKKAESSSVSENVKEHKVDSHLCNSVEQSMMDNNINNSSLNNENIICVKNNLNDASPLDQKPNISVAMSKSNLENEKLVLAKSNHTRNKDSSMSDSNTETLETELSAFRTLPEADIAADIRCIKTILENQDAHLVELSIQVPIVSVTSTSSTSSPPRLGLQSSTVTTTDLPSCLASASSLPSTTPSHTASPCSIASLSTVNECPLEKTATSSFENKAFQVTASSTVTLILPVRNPQLTSATDALVSQTHTVPIFSIVEETSSKSQAKDITVHSVKVSKLVSNSTKMKSSKQEYAFPICSNALSCNKSFCCVPTVCSPDTTTPASPPSRSSPSPVSSTVSDPKLTINFVNTFLNIPTKETSPFSQPKLESCFGFTENIPTKSSLPEKVTKLDTFLFDIKPSELVQNLCNSPLKAGVVTEICGLTNQNYQNNPKVSKPAIDHLPSSFSQVSRSPYSVAKFLGMPSSSKAKPTSNTIQTTKISTLIPKSRYINTKSGALSKSFFYPSTVNSAPLPSSLLHIAGPHRFFRPNFSPVMCEKPDQDQQKLSNKALDVSKSSASQSSFPLLTSPLSAKAAYKKATNLCPHSSKDINSKTNTRHGLTPLSPLAVPKPCLNGSTTLKLKRTPGSFNHYIFAPLDRHDPTTLNNEQLFNSKERKNCSRNRSTVPPASKPRNVTALRQKVPTIKISDINSNPVITEKANNSKCTKNNSSPKCTSLQHSKSSSFQNISGPIPNSESSYSNLSIRPAHMDLPQLSESEILLARHWQGYSTGDLLFHGFRFPTFTKIHDLQYDTDAMPLDYSQSSSKS